MPDTKTITVTPDSAKDAQAQLDAALATAKTKSEDAAAATESSGAAESASDGQLIAGKFKSQDELVSAYQELERKLGGRSQESSEPVKTLELKRPEAPEDKKDSSAAATAKIDTSAFIREFETTGTVSEESLKKLDAAGIPREMLTGTLSAWDHGKRALIAEIGGDAVYRKASEWAGQNLSDGELAAFNRALDSFDPATINLAVHGLVDRWSRSGGKKQELVEGTPTGSADAGSGFGSERALMDAMRDPRYHTDAAYREDVLKKLEASKKLYNHNTR